MRIIFEAPDPCDEYIMAWQFQKQVVLIEHRPWGLNIGLGGPEWLEVNHGSGGELGRI